MSDPQKEINEEIEKILLSARDMEIVDNFVNRKGRYIGDMFLIPIKDLADIIRNLKRER